MISVVKSPFSYGFLWFPKLPKDSSKHRQTFRTFVVLHGLRFHSGGIGGVPSDLHLQRRSWQNLSYWCSTRGMDGLLGVAGIIIHIYYGRYHHDTTIEILDIPMGKMGKLMIHDHLLEIKGSPFSNKTIHKMDGSGTPFQISRSKLGRSKSPRYDAPWLSVGFMEILWIVLKSCTTL